MKTRITLILLLLFIMLSSQAQSFKVGIEAGGSAALGKSVYFSQIGFSTATAVRFGARFGMPIQYNFSRNTNLHSGIFYAMKGIDRNLSNLLSPVNIAYNTLELPLAIVYTSEKQEGSNFFVGGGAYIAYAFKGTLRSMGANGQTIKKPVSFGNDILENDIRRLDYGIHFQTGLAFQNGLLLRLVAQNQINNLAIKDNNLRFNKVKNQVYIALTMAYLF